MSLTFVPRKYTCNSCKARGTVISSISKISDIESYFTAQDRPEQLVLGALYEEVLVRDEFGIITERKVVKSGCQHCGSDDLTPDTVVNYDNVMNFYPQSEAGKWFNGFARHIG